MKNIKTVFGLALAVVLSTTAIMSAAGEKTFQATGNFIRVNGDTLLLRTAAQDLEIKRDAKTKINGTITANAFATVLYDKPAGEAHALQIDIKPGGGTTRKP